MKAIVCTKYGPPDVLQMQTVEKPVPKKNEVLVKVKATSVTAADYRIRGLNVPTGFRFIMRLFFGFFKPRKKVIGANFSGEIETVGSHVENFKTGDPVFGTTGNALGAYAEYLCMPADGAIAKKSNHISFEEAAVFCFGALTALAYLRDMGNLQRGQNVLVYGASGAVGTAMVQLAKFYGARVTAVCSTSNVQMIKSLGADNVIDYTREDFRKAGETYDLVVEVVGKASHADCKSVLSPEGICLLVVADMPLYLRVLWSTIFGAKNTKVGVASDKAEDFLFLKKLLDDGHLKPVIDRSYPFEQMVEAHRYADKGHKKGNLVITLDHN